MIYPAGMKYFFVFLAESEIYKKHEGTDIISYRREAAVYHAVLSTVYHIAVRQYIIWAISSVNHRKKPLLVAKRGFFSYIGL